jgi:hypothetical protein
MANRLDYVKIQKRMSGCTRLIERVKDKNFKSQRWSAVDIEMLKQLFETENVDEIAAGLDMILKKKEPVVALRPKR